jgi:hypothetical protein
MHQPRFTLKCRILALSVALAFGTAPVCAAVEHKPEQQDVDDERLVLEALSERWNKNRAMDWFTLADKSKQADWLAHVDAIGDRYGELGNVRERSEDALYTQLEDALSDAGIEGSPDDYVVSLNRTILVGDVQIPASYRGSLTEACQNADPGLDFTNGVVHYDEQPEPEANKRFILSLLSQPMCRMFAAQRLNQFKLERHALETRYASLFETQLRKDVLEADMKGHLTGGRDAFLKGLDIVKSALNGAADVETGTLTVSTGPDGGLVALPQWLVFVRRNAQGQEDGVVLYRPEENESAVINSRQDLFQYLDIHRLGQTVAGENAGKCSADGSSAQNPAGVDPEASRAFRDVVLDAAGPAQGAPVLKFFDDLCKKSTLWGGNLQFSAYASHDLRDNIGTWVEGRVDLMLRDLERLANSPSLPALAARYTAVMEQYRAFNEEHVPPLREFTRRSESDKLTTFFRQQNLVPGDERVDADTIHIGFNGRKMPWTDWVLEGYRQHGDNPFAGSNNFLRDATLTSSNPKLTARLNESDVKESVERNLRSTYAGDTYAESVEALLDPTDPRYQEARDLRVAAQILEMQLALDIERSRGNVDNADYQWLKGVLDGLPGSVTGPDVEFSRFKLSGTRIPDVWVVSRKSATGRGDSFVFVSGGPYGRMLYKDDPYFQSLIRTHAFRQYFESKVLTRDLENIEQAFRGAYASNYFYTSLEPVKDFKAESDQVLRDVLSNADEATTSKYEVIAGQVTKGVRYATAAICTGATAGVGAAACVIGTGALMGVDTYSAIDNLQRGKKDEALMDVAFLWADAIDVGQGVKAFSPKNLLKIVGKTHFSNVDEAKDAIETAARQRKHLKCTW